MVQCTTKISLSANQKTVLHMNRCHNIINCWRLSGYAITPMWNLIVKFWCNATFAALPNKGVGHVNRCRVHNKIINYYQISKM